MVMIIAVLDLKSDPDTSDSAVSCDIHYRMQYHDL